MTASLISDPAWDRIREQMLARPMLDLEWKHRHGELFTLAVAEHNEQGARRFVATRRCPSESEMLDAFRLLRGVYPDSYIYFWPPKLHRWWSGAPRRRLPIYGYTELDLAVLCALEDSNFGSWLCHQTRYNDELSTLLYLYDNTTACPSTANVLDLDSIIASGYSGSFVDPADEDAYSEWLERHDERHGEDCDFQDCGETQPFSCRTIVDVMRDSEEGLTCEEVDVYLKLRSEWLLWRASVDLKRRVTEVEIRHSCNSWIEPLKPTATPGVYCIQGAGEFVKIGKAKDIAQRVRDIQTNHPVPLRLLAILSNAPEDEKKFHRQLAAHRSHGEWFRLDGEVRKTILVARGVRS